MLHKQHVIFMIIAISGFLVIGCHSSTQTQSTSSRQTQTSQGNQEEGSSTRSIRRYEIVGDFLQIANTAEVMVSGHGGPSAVRTQNQIVFRNRIAKLTLRETEGRILRVDLVLQDDAPESDADRWQRWFRAMGQLRGVGRRVVNGQPVD